MDDTTYGDPDDGSSGFINFRNWYPDYEQFAAFGQPVPDPNQPGEAQTIKTLLDATHNTLGLLVQTATALKDGLTALRAIMPAALADEPAGDEDTADDPFARLDALTKQLDATFAIINPTQKGPTQ